MSAQGPELVAALLAGASLVAVVLLPGRRDAPRRRLVAVVGSAPASTRGERSAPRRARRRGLLALVARARRARGPDAPAALAAASALGAELAALLRAGLGPADAWHHAAAAQASTAGASAAGGAQAPGGARALGRADPDTTHEGRAVAAAAAAAARSARSGGDVSAALRAAASRSGVPAPLLRLAAAWDVAARTGAPTADVLDALAGALAAEREEVLGLRAALAGPRASALVLALLPLAGLGLGLLMGVDPLGVLVGTTVGRLSALVGLGLGAGGWWWTSRMVAAAERVG